MIGIVKFLLKKKKKKKSFFFLFPLCLFLSESESEVRELADTKIKFYFLF